MEKFDVIIIGGGPAGLVASKILVAFGKKTAIIERNKLGGDCTHSGCVPSKTLLKSASAYHHAKNLHRYGLSSDNINIDTSKVLAHVRSVVDEIYSHETPAIFEEAGVRVIEGTAKFKNEHEILVADKTYYADKFIIATGSSPQIPQIDGIENIDYLSNENVFLQETIPSSLIIVGTGAIGVEMACAFQRLGSRVTLLSRSEGILKQNDSYLSAILLEELKKEGIRFINHVRIENIAQKDGEIALDIGTQTLHAQKILFATGRLANTDLDLEKAGVAYDKNGIKVDAYLKTTNPNIYAIGDVSTKYKFTHIAEQNAIVAASNIALPFKKKVSYEHIGWCIYSEPELAQIGLNAQEAKEQYGSSVSIYEMEYKNSDRGYTDVEKIGAIRVAVLKNGKIIGASILGARAGELIHQIQFAKTFNLSFDKLSKMVYIYPTFSDLIKQPAKKFYIDKLLNNPFLKLLKRLKK